MHGALFYVDFPSLCKEFDVSRRHMDKRLNERHSYNFRQFAQDICIFLTSTDYFCEKYLATSARVIEAISHSAI